MILGYSIYELLWLFFIYGFLGWCVEVAYCGVSNGKFVNRGFLNGPICPIYGVGAVTVILCLTPIQDNTFVLFIGSAILTSILELITGFALDKIFHARWWDYSDKPFNIGGYICLKFSIYWGLVCIALMRGVHPTVLKFVHIIPDILGIITLIFFAVVFITDIVITVITINKLVKRMKEMEEIAEKIHTVSDEIGSHIFDTVFGIVKKGEEIYNSDDVKLLRERYIEKSEERKKKFSELKAKYSDGIDDKLDELEDLFKKYTNKVWERHGRQRRILIAFPSLKAKINPKQLEVLKEKIKTKIKK